jgi:hypothetical protein
MWRPTSAEMDEPEDDVPPVWRKPTGETNTTPLAPLPPQLVTQAEIGERGIDQELPSTTVPNILAPNVATKPADLPIYRGPSVEPLPSETTPSPAKYELERVR